MKLRNSFKNPNTNRKNCSYCDKPFIKELWCKKCDPCRVIEGWTSENPDIDKLIKDTIYDTKNEKYPVFLEWIPFDKFTDIEQIGEGGFSKVYSATWIDGKSEYYKNYSSWEKSDPKPIKVALKRLNGSQNMSAEYLNEVFLYFFFAA
jgi:serine/threonine protein kinase